MGQKSETKGWTPIEKWRKQHSPSTYLKKQRKPQPNPLVLSASRFPLLSRLPTPEAGNHGLCLVCTRASYCPEKKFIYIEQNKKNNLIFTGHIFCCSLSIEKVSYSKSNVIFISSTNHAGYSASLQNFFGDPPVSKQCTLSVVRNAVNFFSHYPHMKP